MTDSSEEQFYYRGITLQDFGWIKGKMKHQLYFEACMFTKKGDEFPWKEGDLVDVAIEIAYFSPGYPAGDSLRLITQMHKINEKGEIISYNIGDDKVFLSMMNS